MRITNKMTITGVINNIEKNLKKMDKTNYMLSSGKKISIPEDDPAGTLMAMGYRSTIEEINQYIRNVDNAKTVLSTSDVALDQVTNILQRIRELGVKAANDTLGQSSRDAIANEITEVMEQLVGLANTKVGSRYIFGGYLTKEPPFKQYTGSNDAGVGGPGADLTDVDGIVRTGINSDNITVVNYEGDDGRLLVEIDENVKTAYNISGKEIFVDEGDIFKAVMNLRDSMFEQDVNDNDSDGRSISKGITELDNAINKVIKYRAEVGAKMHRMDQAEEKLESQKINVTDLLSKAEDADIAETIMNLKIQESVQRMSLSVGGRVIQPTLIDFLR